MAPQRWFPVDPASTAQQRWFPVAPASTVQQRWFPVDPASTARQRWFPGGLVPARQTAGEIPGGNVGRALRSSRESQSGRPTNGP
jgi:hypothetical protein